MECSRRSYVVELCCCRESRNSPTPIQDVMSPHCTAVRDLSVTSGSNMPRTAIETVQGLKKKGPIPLFLSLPTSPMIPSPQSITRPTKLQLHRGIFFLVSHLHHARTSTTRSPFRTQIGGIQPAKALRAQSIHSLPRRAEKCAC